MECFGRGSVWNGGWFWIEVGGLVIIVEEDECVEVVRLRRFGSGSIKSGEARMRVVRRAVTIEMEGFGRRSG